MPPLVEFFNMIYTLTHTTKGAERSEDGRTEFCIPHGHLCDLGYYCFGRNLTMGLFPRLSVFGERYDPVLSDDILRFAP